MHCKASKQIMSSHLKLPELDNLSDLFYYIKSSILFHWPHKCSWLTSEFDRLRWGRTNIILLGYFVCDGQTKKKKIFFSTLSTRGQQKLWDITFIKIP